MLSSEKGLQSSELVNNHDVVARKLNSTLNVIKKIMFKIKCNKLLKFIGNVLLNPHTYTAIWM